MFPCFAIDDVSNMMTAHTKSFAKLFMRVLSSDVQLPNLGNILSRKKRAAQGAIEFLIINIVLFISGIKMFWIDASAIMTDQWFMQNHGIYFGEDATRDNKANSVGIAFSAANPERTVTVGEFRGRPIPAAVSLIDLIPEISELGVCKFHHLYNENGNYFSQGQN